MDSNLKANGKFYGDIGMSFRLQVQAPLSLGKEAKALLLIKTVSGVILSEKVQHVNNTYQNMQMCHLKYITDHVN